MRNPGGQEALDRTRTAKVFAVLHGLSESRQARLTHVAERTGLPMTTTHRLLGELVELGIVERTDAGYQLGSALFELAEQAPVRSDFLDVAQPYLQDLYEATHDTLHLAVLDGKDALFVEKIGGHGSVTVSTRIGTRVRAHSTAIGKCLLSFSDGDTLRATGTYELNRVGPRTVTSWPMLGEQLLKARKVGYTVDFEEWRVGLASVAAPILVGSYAVAAVSVTTKTLGFDHERLGPMVRRTADGIADRLRSNLSVAMAV